MNSEDEEAEIKKFVQKKLNLEKQIKGLENEIREKLIAIEIESTNLLITFKINRPNKFYITFFC